MKYKILQFLIDKEYPTKREIVETFCHDDTISYILSDMVCNKLIYILQYSLQLYI